MLALAPMSTNVLTCCVLPRAMHNSDMANIDPVSVLRKRVEGADSLRAVARELGVSAAYVSEILRGTREPGPAVLGPLGIECEVRKIYRRKKQS